jgi:predicted esterase
MPAWFEAASTWDSQGRQDKQMQGVTESAHYVSGILEDEIRMLGGKAEKLVLGGISQGGAVGLWTLLRQPEHRMLGAFVAASTWLPSATALEELLSSQDTTSGLCDQKAEVTDIMAKLRRSRLGRRTLLHTPVFLGHGTDDAYIDIELGRQTKSLLSKIGLQVDWKEYSGAEDEGHWFKVPDEMDDIYHFLKRVTSAEESLG